MLPCLQAGHVCRRGKLRAVFVGHDIRISARCFDHEVYFCLIVPGLPKLLLEALPLLREVAAQFLQPLARFLKIYICTICQPFPAPDARLLICMGHSQKSNAILLAVFQQTAQTLPHSVSVVHPDIRRNKCLYRVENAKCRPVCVQTVVFPDPPSPARVVIWYGTSAHSPVSASPASAPQSRSDDPRPAYNFSLVGIRPCPGLPYADSSILFSVFSHLLPAVSPIVFRILL